MKGSSFYGIPLKYEHSSYKSNDLTKECLKQYLKKISLGETISPLPTVLAHLEGLGKEMGFDLEEKVDQLKVFQLMRQKLNDQRQKNEAQITKFKSQKIRKAKTKIQHLQNLQREFEQDIIRHNRTIAKLLKI